MNEFSTQLHAIDARVSDAQKAFKADPLNQMKDKLKRHQYHLRYTSSPVVIKATEDAIAKLKDDIANYVPAPVKAPLPPPAPSQYDEQRIWAIINIEQHEQVIADTKAMLAIERKKLKLYDLRDRYERGATWKENKGVLSRITKLEQELKE